MLTYVDKNGVESGDKKVAVASFDEEQSKYYVKVGQTHANGGSLYNPRDSMTRPSTLDYYDNVLGKKHYEFKEVKKTVFIDYLNFLKTGLVTYLRNAEREVMYGSKH